MKSEARIYSEYGSLGISGDLSDNSPIELTMQTAHLKKK